MKKKLAPLGALAVLALSLSACGSDAPSGSSSSAAGSSAAPTEARRSGPAPVGWGETVTLAPVAENSAPIAQFTFDTPEKGFECTGEYASEPENGVIVAIPVKIELMNGADEYNIQGKDFHQVNFSYVDPQGETKNLDMQTKAALLCVDEDEKPNFDIGDGARTSGMLTFDLPAAEGKLVLTEPGTGKPGWEWTL